MILSTDTNHNANAYELYLISGQAGVINITMVRSHLVISTVWYFLMLGVNDTLQQICSRDYFRVR